MYSTWQSFSGVRLANSKQQSCCGNHSSPLNSVFMGRRATADLLVTHASRSLMNYSKGFHHHSAAAAAAAAYSVSSLNHHHHHHRSRLSEAPGFSSESAMIDNTLYAGRVAVSGGRPSYSCKFHHYSAASISPSSGNHRSWPSAAAVSSKYSAAFDILHYAGREVSGRRPVVVLNSSRSAAEISPSSSSSQHSSRPLAAISSKSAAHIHATLHAKRAVSGGRPVALNSSSQRHHHSAAAFSSPSSSSSQHSSLSSAISSKCVTNDGANRYTGRAVSGGRPVALNSSSQRHHHSAAATSSSPSQHSSQSSLPSAAAVASSESAAQPDGDTSTTIPDLHFWSPTSSSSSSATTSWSSSPPSRWVLFSDLHVTPRTLPICLDVLRRVRDEAAARSAGVLFLGDFWHIRGALPVEPLNALVRLFASEWDVPTLMLVGNHDQVTLGGLTHGLTPLAAAAPHHIHVFDGPALFAGALWLPYRRNSDELIAAVAAAMASETPPQAIFAHVDIQGAFLNDSCQARDGISPKIFPQGVPVYTGHYHKPHVVPNTSIRYVGSPYQGE